MSDDERIKQLEDALHKVWMQATRHLRATADCEYLLRDLGFIADLCANQNVRTNTQDKPPEETRGVTRCR